ncbi:MAG: hypothetical protein MJ079_00885, partial [Ruminococcus sp.]|nr:hypothetical protein [Ruminococcus sp.]
AFGDWALSLTTSVRGGSDPVAATLCDADFKKVGVVVLVGKLTVKGYEFKLALNLKSSKFNVFYTPRPEGESIPRGTSEIEVVDADYQYTPGVVYPNNQPTDIGGVTTPVDVPEETTGVEETSEGTGEDTSEPSSEPPVTSEITTEAVSEAPVSSATEQVHT